MVRIYLFKTTIEKIMLIILFFSSYCCLFAQHNVNKLIGNLLRGDGTMGSFRTGEIVQITPMLLSVIDLNIVGNEYYYFVSINDRSAGHLIAPFYIISPRMFNLIDITGYRNTISEGFTIEFSGFGNYLSGNIQRRTYIFRLESAEATKERQEREAREAREANARREQEAREAEAKRRQQVAEDAARRRMEAEQAKREKEEKEIFNINRRNEGELGTFFFQWEQEMNNRLFGIGAAFYWSPFQYTSIGLEFKLGFDIDNFTLADYQYVSVAPSIGILYPINKKIKLFTNAIFEIGTFYLWSGLMADWITPGFDIGMQFRIITEFSLNLKYRGIWYNDCYTNSIVLSFSYGYSL